MVFASDQEVLTWVSPSVRSILGWRPLAMVGKHISEFVHPNDANRMRSAGQLIDSGQPARYEARFVHRNGKHVWLAITARAQYDESGHVAGGSAAAVTSVAVSRSRVRCGPRSVHYAAARDAPGDSGLLA